MKLFVSVKRSNCADKEGTELFSYQKQLWKKSWARQSAKILNCQYQNKREYYILHILLSKKESHVYAFKERESRVCFKRPIYNKLAPYFCDESQNCYAGARSFNEELKLARRSRK